MVWWRTERCSTNLVSLSLLDRALDTKHHARHEKDLLHVRLICQEDHEATTDGESNKEANLGDEIMPIALLVSKPGLEVDKYGSSLCTYPRGKKCLFFL